MADETYTPDKLLAGSEFPALTVPVVIASGQNLSRGAVLAEITATGEYVIVDKAEDNGAQNAKLILVEAVDASLGAKPGVAYRTGIFNPDALSFAAGTVVADVKAALDTRCIFLRSVRTL